MMKSIEGKETLSLLDLKGKIEFEEPKKMVELSFDLDEKICKMLEVMVKERNKSEEEIVNEIVEKSYLDYKNRQSTKR
jgi:hypothetical protein